MPVASEASTFSNTSSKVHRQGNHAIPRNPHHDWSERRWGMGGEEGKVDDHTLETATVFRGGETGRVDDIP